MSFDDIRPYYDYEINSALKRITAHPVFNQIINYLFPNIPSDILISNINNIHSAVEFQKRFMYSAIRTIIAKTSNGLTSSGFENIKKESPYLFISNHRDIVLDAAILQVLLVEHGFETSEIGIGDNLLLSDFVTDIVKVNRIFTIYRNPDKNKKAEVYGRLSAYIRHTLTEKKVSVWIAQRNGRTKDGNDKTSPNLLKMLFMSSPDNFVESFKGLNIVPVAISYEYEPCDFLKTQELYYSSSEQKYVKKADEDFNSILTGINQQKGRIHLAIGKPINAKMENGEWRMENGNDFNNKITQLAELIDKEIYQNYKLWPNNFIASDLLNREDKLSESYTSEEKQAFIDFMDKRLEKLDGDKDLLQQIFLKIYANPVR